MIIDSLLKGHKVAYRHSTGRTVVATVVDIIRNEWVIVRRPDLDLPIPVQASRLLYREIAK